jgi:hypothetical protein
MNPGATLRPLARLAGVALIIAGASYLALCLSRSSSRGALGRQANVNLNKLRVHDSAC